MQSSRAHRVTHSDAPAELRVTFSRNVSVRVPVVSCCQLESESEPPSSSSVHSCTLFPWWISKVSRYVVIDPYPRLTWLAELTHYFNTNSLLFRQTNDDNDQQTFSRLMVFVAFEVAYLFWPQRNPKLRKIKLQFRLFFPRVPTELSPIQPGGVRQLQAQQQQQHQRTEKRRKAEFARSISTAQPSISLGAPKP